MSVARTLLLPVAFACALAARGQSVRWEPAGGKIAVGQLSPLQLVCEDCEAKDGIPVPPKVDGLTVEYQGTSSSFTFSNGASARSFGYNYAMLLTKNEAVDIPAFDLETTKGRIHVEAVHFDPAAATVGGNGRSLDSAVNSRLAVTPTEVWAGQVFNLAYDIQAAADYLPDFGHRVFDWTPDPLVAEDWAAPETLETNNGSEARVGLAYRTRAIAPKAGTFQLNPVKQLVNLSVATGFGFIQRQYEQFAVPSTAPSLTVRPLPPAAPGFTGAVGDFKLVSKVVPERAAPGEPITWTLELSGTGNWPNIAGLPSREVSQDFRVVHPQTKKTLVTGKIFDATLTEDVVLIPTKAGRYSLAPVRFVYFDPQLSAYRTIATAPATLEIVPAAAPAPGPAALAETPAPGAPQAPLTGPALPRGIPRDPLAGPASAAEPLPIELWAILLATPFALVAAGWLWLALLRAQQTDPARRLRAARGRLAATLARLRSAPASPTALASDLLAWQRDAAILWSLAAAAPAANSFADASWSLLWEESERTLYGPSVPLPPNWTERADRALAGKRAPRFTGRQLWLPRNLFPALLLVGTLAGTVHRAGAAAADAYRRGDFAAAEQVWRHAAGTDPVDWTARHNLSLALSQQGRWPEAAAEAAAAFVQQPQNDQVRWQWSLASEKAGYVPEPLAPFLTPGPAQVLARFASPAMWQLALVAAAVLSAASLLALLLRAYGRLGGAATRPLALSLLVLSSAAAAVAVLGWRSYGAAGDATAVVVWRTGTLRSVPTEADTQQKTTPLPAGSTATVDKRFLGWIRLNFNNGQSGWVRQDETISLWR